MPPRGLYDPRSFKRLHEPGEVVDAVCRTSMMSGPQAGCSWLFTRRLEHFLVDAAGATQAFRSLNWAWPLRQALLQ